MPSLKNRLKYLFIKTHSLSILDRINFTIARVEHFLKNKHFKKLNPKFSIPPDYFLYENYKLDYREYSEDGRLSAREIFEWARPYLKNYKRILEWGCGVARITRHIHEFVNPEARIFAVDINEGMIDWDKKNIEAVIFDSVGYHPPTQFGDGYFNLIIAISVFTHIEKEIQSHWINEISRILERTGVFLFTTHGKKFFGQLSGKDKNKLLYDGSFTVSYHRKGHRMMSTYNNSEHFRRLIEKKFNVLEYYDGEEYPDKVGGQDLWIVQKL